MIKGDKVWIVAEYTDADPEDVIQIGMYKTWNQARVAATKWAASRLGTEWNTVIFEAEVTETVN